MKLDYIKCHGSGNEFVMVDATRHNMQGIDLAELSRYACNRNGSIGSDGLLLLCEKEGVYGMRMFNPDGSEAEMCGNGIRCVARLASRYVNCSEFDMWSGKNTYHITRAKDIFGGIPTYGVAIEAKVEGKALQIVPSLHDTLQWTAIDVGNPHIVACVEEIDFSLLKELGERVVTLKKEFPKGVNISLVKRIGTNRIFVVTYERGAGITPSCGTAMTSSATAMALNNLCDYDHIIEVENRGGKVQCICSKEGDKLYTRLIGNATYMSRGRIEVQGDKYSFAKQKNFNKENALYDKFVAHIKRY